MSPDQPPSATSPAIPGPVPHPSSSPRPRGPRRAAMTGNPLNLSTDGPESRRAGEASASRRNREGQNEKENRTTGDQGGGEGHDDMERDSRGRGLGSRNLVNKPIEIKRAKQAIEVPTTHQQPPHQSSRPRLRIPDSTDSERDDPSEVRVGGTHQNPKNRPGPTSTSQNRRRDVAQEETMSEEEDCEPPARRVVKRKQDENRGGNDVSDNGERPHRRHKTASSPQRSSHSSGDESSKDTDRGQDRSNLAAFSKRERRRKAASGAKASTWIKAKTKEKKEKTNLVCLSERGPREEWPESWKALADECSGAIVRKIREVTGTSIKQKWSETPNTDEEGNEMLVIHFSAEAGMKDHRNVAFAQRIVELIRKDEKEYPVLTVSGRHYISDKFLLQKVSKAINGFKRAWKAQTDEDLATTIADTAKATRMQGRQMTAAQNLQKGAEIFLEEHYPLEELKEPKERESRKKLLRLGKQIISAEWMSETESGPEDRQERKDWLKVIGKGRDERGQPTTRYDIKGKGRAVYEVRPVTWRSKHYEWYLDQCRSAYESEHRIRTEERAYPRRHYSTLSKFAAPKPLINLEKVETMKGFMEREELEICSQWGEEDDEDVVWFMKRIRRLKKKIETEGGSDGDGETEA